MNISGLHRNILDIFDYAYTNSPIRIPAKTCREVGKILHVGMFIEEHLAQIPGYKFTSDEIKQLQGKKTDFCVEVAKNVRATYEEMNKEWWLYDDSINFSDINIGYIVGRLNNIYISDPNSDVFGDALEIFRSKWAKQEGGQFFTDQKVTSLAIKVIEFNPVNGDRLVDLCAGTGGFLLAGLNQIKKIADNSNEDEKFVTLHAKSSLKGFEIDGSVAELGNATLSGRTGSSKDIFINESNSLDKNATKEKFSKAATNPPFGAKISIQDDYILSQYELAKISNANCDGLIPSFKLFKRAPDILFIERNIDILEENGLLAIVVPYQILSGPQTYYVRNWLLKNTRVVAVIDLPSETFQPHTGTKTCLLVVQKLKKPLKSLDDCSDYEIFMSCPKWIGHDRRGNILFKKGIDGCETNEVLTDFPELEAAYQFYKKTGKIPESYERAYIVKSTDILNDGLLKLNAAYYNPKHINTRNAINQSNFEMIPLYKLVERVFFPGRFKRNYVERYERAIPFLGGTNITQMIDHTDKWLRHDDRNLKHLAVKKGWILVTRSGTTGIVSSVPEHWDGYAVSEHVIRIIPNGKIDSAYLLAYLKTPQCQAALAQGIFGSVIDEITPETIENISVPVPKDKQLYESIVKRVTEAETARSKALTGLYGAIDTLTAGLSN